MAHNLREIEEQMSAVGIDLPPGHDLIVNGRNWRRFKPNNSNFKRGKDAWYGIWEQSLSNGKIYYFGTFGIGSQTYKIEHSRKGWTREEWTELESRKKADQEVIDKALEERRKSAREKAAKMWERAADSVSASHPYVRSKKIRPIGARQLRNQILVPVWKEEMLVGLQTIFPDDTAEGERTFQKKFLSGTETKGSFAVLGTLPEKPEVIFLTEGWATGCSIFEAVGQPVIVAFSAGNLLPVAETLRAKYPDSKICIAADNDAHYLRKLREECASRFGIDLQVHSSRSAAQDQCFDGGRVCAWWSKKDGEACVEYEEWIGDRTRPSHRSLNNTGVVKANIAAARVNACVFIPRFSNQQTWGTDFNDLASEEGINAVREQLEYSSATPVRAVKRGRSTSKTNEITENDKTILRVLADRYVAIDNTDTCWDLVYHRLAKISFIKQYYGSRLVSSWLQGLFGNRRIIQPEQLIFEPDPKKVPEGSISMFEGWPLVPTYDTSKCHLLIEHLFKICGEDENIFNWISSWLAYPLQHPGAKMASGLMIYGEREGTGKSIFFNVIAKIYGKYGCSVNQTMIQSDFNGWISQKLFMVGEEVVTNQDKRTLKGMLKNLVTNPTHTINEKGYPARFEVNKTNIVFLSNEQQPGILDPKDRRYMAIRFEEYSPPEYFQALAEEINNGGAAALYGWLLTLDLDEIFQQTFRYP
ncbi:DUF5906 domain-containing protein, partial [uncultured Parasutterella sp.]|uniref:DUF5906 domain-containing protein n=1 Tax=uncultured Parasutterella sp. TaxID=1263098 RepID=UPI00272CC982